MADVKWIKLATGLPDNRKIKQIRKLPDGDTIALMWVFLMCLAGEVNDDGAVYFTPEIPYTDEMLSDQFAMDVKTVRLGLQVFQQFGMIEIIDQIICLSAWEKWQAVDGLAAMREKNRLRVAKHREKKKLLKEPSNVTCNVTVTSGNGIDKNRKEEERDKEKENNISRIVSYLNEKAGTQYRASSKKTQSSIKARIAEGFTFDDFQTVIDKKCADWIGDEKMERYLRPETLFGPKFENYLNERVTRRKTVPAKGNGLGGNMDELDGLF